MKMISRRDFLKASAVVGAAGVLTACGGSSASTAASSAAASTAASSTAAAASGSANIGVCIYQFADNFMTLYRTDLEEYLKDMGYA
ncbi:MAG: twin-arginine translocation signal domain-containing protein, partial [Faecalibacterium prausnitzii]